MRRLRSILGVVICCGVQWTCYGAEEVHYEGPLRLTIHSDLEEPVPYEPLYVVVSLVNTSTEEIRFSCRSIPSLTYYKSHLGGEWEVCGYSKSAGYTFGGYYTLAPKGSEAVEVGILFQDTGDGEYVLSQTGRYGLKARMRLGRGEIMETGPIYVNVREGTEADNGAARLLVEGGAWNIIQFSYFRNESALASLKSAVEKYPGSVLADYARYYLGFADYFWLRKASPCDPNQAERAMGYFRSITGRRKSLAFRGFLGQAQVVAVCGQVGDSTPPGEFRRALEAKIPQAREMGLEVTARQAIQRLAGAERRESGGKGRD